MGEMGEIVIRQPQERVFDHTVFFMGSISVQLFKVLTVNLDFAFGLARRGEIIGELHSQPRLRRAAEGLR